MMETNCHIYISFLNLVFSVCKKQSNHIKCKIIAFDRILPNIVRFGSIYRISKYSERDVKYNMETVDSFIPNKVFNKCVLSSYYVSDTVGVQGLQQ